MDNKLALLGNITRIGLKGDMEITSVAQSRVQLAKDELVFIMVNGAPVPFFIEFVHATGIKYTLKLAEINTQEQADAYLNKTVYVQLENIVEPTIEKPDSPSIIGYKAIDKNHGEIGIIDDIIDMPAQQLIRIVFNNKEVLIPVVDDFIKEINHENSTIHLDIPDGLLDMYL